MARANCSTIDDRRDCRHAGGSVTRAWGTDPGDDGIRWSGSGSIPTSLEPIDR